MDQNLQIIQKIIYFIFWYIFQTFFLISFISGIYHGRIILPPAYPMKPPNVIFTTPNGRFETHKKICLSISGYHPETWRPSWSIRTALLALIGFFPTHGNGAIGSLGKYIFYTYSNFRK